MAETRRVFKLIEMLPKIDNVLLKVERLAILMVIILTKLEWPSINKLIRMCFFRLELSRLHRLDALTLKYFRYCFWLERVWSASLILSYRSSNYWYIATAVSFAISTIYSACILELVPSKRQKSRKNGILSPNPRETNMRSEALTTGITSQEMEIFMVKRFSSLLFIISPSSVANFWGRFFCLSHVFNLIFFALRLDYNFWPPSSTKTKNTREAWRYLFWIEQAAIMILELHYCVHGIPYSLAIARCLFVLTNIGYIVAQFIEPEQWQQKIIKTIFKFRKTPKEENNRREREANKGEQSEKEIPKFENDGPKENLENLQESAKEENSKWDEDLVEADDLLKEKSEVEEEVVKDENNIWEEYLVEAHDQLKEKSEVEEEVVKDENNIWEEYLVEAHDHLKEKSEVDHREAAKEETDKRERLILPELAIFLNWKEERRKANEASNFCRNWNSEIENELKATTAENERLKAENNILKREKEFLESERLVYEDEKTELTQQLSSTNSWYQYSHSEEELADIEEIERLKAENNILKREKEFFEESERLVYEDEKTELTQQLSATNSWYQYYYQVAMHNGEFILQLEQERNNLSAKLCAATQCSDYYKACFRDSEENSLRFMEKNNELARKLHDETILASSYHKRVYELEEKCRMLEEAKTNLTARLCAATASSELYRSMLHNAGC